MKKAKIYLVSIMVVSVLGLISPSAFSLCAQCPKKYRGCERDSSGEMACSDGNGHFADHSEKNAKQSD